MTLPAMIYGAVLALLVAGAAHFIDRGLRSLGRPTRWVWVGALVVGGLAPFLPRLVPAGAPEAVPGGLGLPIEPLHDVGAMAASGTSGSRAFLPAVEGSLEVLWILGSALVLLVVAGGWLRLRRQRVAWETENVGGEDVLVSEALGPAVLGLIRPRIVLPRWALALPGKDLELVILHEREHREARDPALLVAGFLLTALAPWNPAVWWMLRRLRLAVEGDCDGRVLARGVRAKTYVRLLLEVASSAGRAPALAPALTETGGTSLSKRLMMIRSTIGKHRVWASILAVSVGMALLAVACEAPMPQESAELSISAVETEASGRLATAVDSNWITQEQADGIAAELTAEGRRLRAAVEVGEMTEEEARGTYLRLELRALGASIRASVAAGAITAHEGQAAYEAYRALTGEGRERNRGDGLRVRLAKAVEDGWITREQAGAVFEELGGVQWRLQAAVKAGEMTREEAGGTHLRFELGAIGTALRERVAAGELTAEEGRAASEGYRAAMGEGRGTTNR